MIFQISGTVLSLLYECNVELSLYFGCSWAVLSVLPHAMSGFYRYVQQTQRKFQSVYLLEKWNHPCESNQFVTTDRLSLRPSIQGPVCFEVCCEIISRLSKPNHSLIVIIHRIVHYSLSALNTNPSFISHYQQHFQFISCRTPMAHPKDHGEQRMSVILRPILQKVHTTQGTKRRTKKVNQE